MRRSKLSALFGAGVVACACGGKSASSVRGQPGMAGHDVAGSGSVMATAGAASSEQPAFGSAGSSAGTASVAGAAAAAGAAGSSAEGGAANPWPVPPPDPDTEAVAFQINAQHDGSQPNDQLRLPLQQRWAHDFDGEELGYATLARGRVFVTVGHGVNTRVAALSAQTGELLWSGEEARSTYARANLAYEDERVFSANIDGLVSAFDAETGRTLWSTKLDESLSMASEPVAVARRIYVTGNSTLYALSGLDGSVLWKASLGASPHGSPTVTNGVVYLALQGFAFTFDAQSGAALAVSAMLTNAGNEMGAGSGRGGDTAPLSAGILYMRSWHINRPLDMATGLFGATFRAGPTPAVQRDWLVTAYAGKVLGSSLAGAGTPWTFSQEDQYFDSGALIVGDKVAALSIQGKLVILGRDDGKLLSEQQLDEPVSREAESASGHPVMGLSAGANLLLVPAFGRLLAY